MRILSFAAIGVLGLAPPASAQTVPEGIHSLAAGPATICGIKASSAAEFADRLERSGLERQDGGPRFDVYMSPSVSDDIVQWAVTRKGEPAYPAVTCRHVYKTPDGSWMQDRQMRCDASREACDALFVEFNELDKRVSAELARSRR